MEAGLSDHVWSLEELVGPLANGEASDSMTEILLRPPNVFLTVGVIFISAAAVFAYTGKGWVRFSGWVDREKQPRVFWGEVAAYFFGGVFFVGYFLYKVYELSN